ncbi:MAG TPA: glycosyltransferase family 4 protein, partial [Verrucomicrobiae bacterium]
SDALLLTSLHEGSPTVVKEAIACGLPVVSVDVGDVAERIEKIDGCYLAQPNPADLAEKVCKVLLGRRRLECRDQLGELSVLSVARKLEGFYESVARHQHKPQNALPARDLLPGIRASA